ncbi:MAG TPA: ABC transporter ATP-binding protein [Candidatus Methylomirabilis sp.]|nr:ABC transporter ATP-binding protein [Candidatus Methylomirabilis sp.]
MVPPAEPELPKGAALRLERLTKRFGSVVAVREVCLDIPAGCFVTLLGPSGSGKTTTLNLIAGFVLPDAGEIYVDRQAISGVPPHRRNVGMVFQNYALFPHMTVFENVAFPLRMRTALAGAALGRRVEETLDLVQLGGLGARYPRQLSGGQQQRVAMARALVSDPRLLLMDEPLGALDKKLRERLQLEIKAIHRRVGATIVYVTHDQSEALTLSDLVVVMDRGRVVQIGSPRSLYEAPDTGFVADFLGGANLMPAQVTGAAGEDVIVALPGGATIPVRPSHQPIGALGPVQLMIRPEDIEVSRSHQNDPERVALAGEVVEAAYLGDAIKLVVAVSGGLLTAKVTGRRGAEFAPGDAVTVGWPRSATRILPATSTEAAD